LFRISEADALLLVKLRFSDEDGAFMAFIASIQLSPEWNGLL
jgi:hypothetical protein